MNAPENLKQCGSCGGWFTATTCPKCSATGNTRQVAKLEHVACNEPLATGKAEKENPSRVHIRFESVRKRLLDPDNPSAKWLLDCLRYCNLIDGDEPEKITLETTQRKCGKGESEKTVIEIFY